MITKSGHKLVILGTGGTIAGRASSQSDNVGYSAAQVSVAQLAATVPTLDHVLAAYELVTEQVAQVDSKDMSGPVSRAIWERAGHYLAQSDVKGVVITHGTDTLEETAYFLHRTLAPDLLRAKPVVLTCAMRPASAVAPDGPQNLLDAVTVALTGGARGVTVVCAGTVHGAVEVQKVHTYRLDAFDSGDGGPLARVEEGGLRMLRPWPEVPTESASDAIEVMAGADAWPRVEIVMSYAGVGASIVDALLVPASSKVPGVSPLRGLIIAGTGNGTVHESLQAALLRARDAGIAVVRASRCSQGRVLPRADDEFPDSDGLSAVKARIDLMLRLMA